MMRAVVRTMKYVRGSEDKKDGFCFDLKM